MGPTTGDYVSYGEDWETGASLAIDEINGAGGCTGYRLKEVVGDDQADPAQGVSLANQFVSQDVFAVIGPVFSAVTQAAIGVLDRASIPTFTASGAADITERGLRSVFRMSFRDEVTGIADGKAALSVLDAETAVVVHDNGPVAKGLADSFTQTFEQGGGQVLSVEVVDPDSTDYTSTITKIKGEDPDLVYFSGYYPQGGLLAKQAQELGLWSSNQPGNGWLFGNSNYDPAFVEIAGEAAEGVLIDSWTSPLTDPGMADYLGRFRAKFGHDPGTLGHWAYDAVYTLCEGVKAGGVADREKVTEALHAPDFKYIGVSGEISFDEKGDRYVAPIALLIVRDGQFTVYQGT